MERWYLRIWSIITVFVILAFFAMRLPIMAQDVEPEVPAAGESISESASSEQESDPEPEQSSEPELDQGSESGPEQSSEPEPEQEVDYSSIGNLNVSDIVSLHVAVLQIRNCLIFFVFGVIPLLVACFILYLFMRWIYRLILSAV